MARVTGVQLNERLIRQDKIGQIFRLVATVLPYDASDKRVTWSVSGDGVTYEPDRNDDTALLVTGVKDGGADITVTTVDGGFTATATFIVGAGIKVRSIDVSPSELSLAVGQTARLTATVSPSNATVKTVIWMPQDNKVSVDNRGNVTALKPGTSKIKVMSADGSGARNWVTVSVSGSDTSAPPTTGGVVITPTTLDMTTGQTQQVTANGDSGVTWSTDDEGVKVDQSGTVTAVSEGTYKVTATTPTGGTAYINVNVTKPKAQDTTPKYVPPKEAGELIQGSDWASLMGALSDNSHFMAFMENAKLAYDYTGERIICFNEEKNYMYVYMLRTATWHKMSMPANTHFVRILNSYPQTYLSVSYDQPGAANFARILNFSTPLDVTSKESMKGVIATRPIDLGEPDIRKTIKSIRIRGQYNRNDVRYILLGSMDGINWGVLPSLRGGSYKLYRLVILSSLSPTERISWIDIDYESRFGNKLR